MERRLSARVKAAGGLSIKVMPVLAGTPDRLVMLPPGRMLWVETKAPGGRLRPMQHVFRRRAERIGVPVAVLSSTAEVDAWMDEQTREVAPCSRTGYNGPGKPPGPADTQEKEETMHVTINLDTREELSEHDRAILRGILNEPQALATLDTTTEVAEEPEAPTERVSPYGFADPDREPGKPRAGNKRRSAAEKAEDDAYFAAQEQDEDDDEDDDDEDIEVDLDDDDEDDDEALLAQAQQRAQQILADGDRKTVERALKKVKAPRISAVEAEDAQAFLDALGG